MGNWEYKMHLYIEKMKSAPGHEFDVNRVQSLKIAFLDALASTYSDDKNYERPLE